MFVRISSKIPYSSRQSGMYWYVLTIAVLVCTINIVQWPMLLSSPVTVNLLLYCNQVNQVQKRVNSVQPFAAVESVRLTAEIGAL